ncbi:hypothetical protein LI168_12285, partial [Desulfovibrio desulfuricans]|nr:hypothetical protein [Desulfovibrio desulfuricans]MCB6554002.1 hypothetical protein [Desulfovibrio desulfuricans]MCB6565978.1 hypothetical protein [Desulfovibrio desulfuricans]MCB7347046.1 hypothetical protein [Desulfovibrio desulfuricans]MCQ4862484.1 hypothetical protein [Desulfovibrio desulfuricans]
QSCRLPLNMAFEFDDLPHFAQEYLVGTGKNCTRHFKRVEEADQALWAGVLNFWFLGRVFDRVRS